MCSHVQKQKRNQETNSLERFFPLILSAAVVCVCWHKQNYNK